jgi:hypothetical protein
VFKQPTIKFCTNSTMLTSQFTREQDDYIKSFMPYFDAVTLKADPDLENKSTTKYRKEKTAEIMESNLFDGVDNKKDLKAVCHLSSPHSLWLTFA